MKDSRRDFLKKGMLAGAGALMIPELAKAVVQENMAVNAPKISLKKDSVILLQGDSITDAGRDYSNNNANSMQMLGNGYSLFIASQLLTKEASKQLKIYNRGISGNKVYQLRDRWEMECLAFMPDVLSILIGVNDYWHTLGGGYKGTAEVYENDYRNLLRYTKEKLPNIQFVICEPFALKGGSAIEDEKWFPKFDEYRSIAKKLAAEFNAVFVPFQAGFDAAIKQAPTRYWAYDGVHPDLPGRQLMANMWLEACGLK
ncbi:lysophospholipase L1-like esterase [Parabacteroides sp. PF5-5]|uniref:SGNH/GDSL hydrolase family protein n=1 Tax=unclassified Parabacteroides TaxID=2649774 RepID=UPI00247435B5|nr:MULTISPECIES: SGNH/GDSL hydrolase family protein [unclassified Parabacteroides]MDH6303767.1 lysophospholipase L1-like esterase [Parabacteroides sp. PH5-39]MDH6314384.1 lysophospholipase L1-like esterase [Parabacteroides sp. PF5-13]MDH6318551.1 lysophospholipase L1-like esterase [Parabacteroides sp. PH5-13]MDH6322156.1 lysophospholipase L1-like esterase [Parabacteroides sp. PH5-8]MDH6325764.1 lysophospholipase L1-like esterase [Parabacteroides sp. PH5-41]